MNRFRYVFRYLRHVLTARTRHGTHSPFVYRLLDEVIYVRRQPGESDNRLSRLIHRLVRRFRPVSVIGLSDCLSDREGEAETPLDMLIFDAASPLDHLWRYWPALHQGSVLVVTGIYRNDEALNLWRTIQATSGVTITIDLFHAGLVFFHAGQAREDFRIRWS